MGFLIIIGLALFLYIITPDEDINDDRDRD